MAWAKQHIQTMAGHAFLEVNTGQGLFPIQPWLRITRFLEVKVYLWGPEKDSWLVEMWPHRPPHTFFWDKTIKKEDTWTPHVGMTACLLSSWSPGNWHHLIGTQEINYRSSISNVYYQPGSWFCQAQGTAREWLSLCLVCTTEVGLSRLAAQTPSVQPAFGVCAVLQWASHTEQRTHRPMEGTAPPCKLRAHLVGWLVSKI